METTAGGGAAAPDGEKRGRVGAARRVARADDVGLALVRELLDATPEDSRALGDVEWTRGFVDRVLAHPGYPDSLVGQGKQDRSLVTYRVRELIGEALDLDHLPPLPSQAQAAARLTAERDRVALRIAVRISPSLVRRIDLRDRDTIAAAVDAFSAEPEFAELQRLRAELAAARRVRDDIGDADRGLAALVRRALARSEGLDPEQIENMPRSGSALRLPPKLRTLLDQVPGRRLPDKIAVLLECADLERIKRAAAEGRISSLSTRRGG